MQPLFDIKIELDGETGEIVFDPPFQAPAADVPSLRGTINGWLKDFFAMAAVTMPRYTICSYINLIILGTNSGL